MWLVENWGVDKFRDAIGARMGDTLAKVRPRCSRVAVECCKFVSLVLLYLLLRDASDYW